MSRKLFMVVVPKPVADWPVSKDPGIRSYYTWTDQVAFVATSEGVYPNDIAERMGFNESNLGIAVSVDMSLLAGWVPTEVIQWFQENQK